MSDDRPVSAASSASNDPAGNAKAPWATAPGFRQIVAAAKDRVYPSVVFIKCIRDTYEGGRKLQQDVSGSGVLISARGEIVTNWHVIENAVEVRCLLSDGRALHAEIVGSDKDTDLALLRLKPAAEDRTFPHAELGDSERMRAGDFVMAMGAPWGLNRSVSIGIVSCTRRFLPQMSEYSLWIQTDAAISPGNSGGPLVDTEGRIIGINTRGAMLGGDVGFAVPSNTVARVVGQLRSEGRVNWSWCGLHFQPLRDFAHNMFFDADTGVIVASTDPGSPARRAGIQPQDRIVRVNGTPITAVTDEDLPAVRRLVGMLEKHHPAELEIVRADGKVTVAIVPTAKGDVEGEEIDCPRWNLTAKSINQFDTPTLYFARQEGVFVYGLRYPGNAAKAGLRRNDIIIAVDGVAVRSLADLRAAYETAVALVDTQHRVLVSVLRGGQPRQLVIDFSRDYERD